MNFDEKALHRGIFEVLSITLDSSPKLKILSEEKHESLDIKLNSWQMLNKHSYDFTFWTLVLV
jgi:hypothetical protein